MSINLETYIFPYVDYLVDDGTGIDVMYKSVIVIPEIVYQFTTKMLEDDVDVVKVDLDEDLVIIRYQMYVKDRRCSIYIRYEDDIRVKFIIKDNKQNKKFYFDLSYDQILDYVLNDIIPPFTELKEPKYKFPYVFYNAYNTNENVSNDPRKLEFPTKLQMDSWAEYYDMLKKQSDDVEMYITISEELERVTGTRYQELLDAGKQLEKSLKVNGHMPEIVSPPEEDT